MKLLRKPIQRISLAAFYGIFMYSNAATSVFAQSCDGDVTGGPGQGADCIGGGTSIGETELFNQDGTGIFNRVIEILLFLVGAVSVIMLIVGGIRYVISSGDQNAVTAAKNTILYAIIGLVVAFLAFGAVRFVTDALAPDGI